MHLNLETRVEWERLKGQMLAFALSCNAQAEDDDESEISVILRGAIEDVEQNMDEED
jgi:hypothetical protein